MSSPLLTRREIVHSVPALPGMPVLGNLLAFRRDRLAVVEAAARVGPIARVSVGPIPIYVVTDADLAHEVLVDHAADFVKAAGMHFLKPMLGDGLLSAEGELHKRHRKLLAPAFAPKRLAAYGEAMVGETAAHVARWAPGSRVDLASELLAMTLAIAGRTLFGADVRGDASAVARGLEMGMRAMTANLSSLVQLGYEWPLPRHLRMRRAVKILDEIVYRLIADGRAHATDRGDVLSLLLLARDDEDGSGLTDRQVRDEVMTLLLAGHETTANTLSWTWFELGRNRDVLARLEAEVAPLGDRAVAVDDLAAMPWTLAVLEETLRLHPPAYQVGRESVREVTIGGHRLPAKSIVAVNILGIHRRADYFPEPLAYRPARMLPEAKQGRPRHHFLPFGAGPRVCIGSHFALLEAQLALATLVQRAKIEPLATQAEPEPLVTLRIKGGLPAIVSPR